MLDFADFVGIFLLSVINVIVTSDIGLFIFLIFIMTAVCGLFYQLFRIGNY